MQQRDILWLFYLTWMTYWPIKPQHHFTRFLSFWYLLTVFFHFQTTETYVGLLNFIGCGGMLKINLWIFTQSDTLFSLIINLRFVVRVLMYSVRRTVKYKKPNQKSPVCIVAKTNTSSDCGDIAQSDSNLAKWIIFSTL